MSADELSAWRDRGLRVLAVQPSGEVDPRPPNIAAAGVAAGSTIIVVGPESVVEPALTGD